MIFITTLSLQQYPKLNTFLYYHNFCYIRIVDEAYIGYKREYNTISSLQKLYPDYKFEFANDYDDVQLGVDIVVKKDDKTIGGFQVKSVIYRDSDKSYNLDAKRVNHKKFQKCLKEYGFEPQYIYVDKKGNRTKRMVEPYKLTDSDFWGYDIAKNEIRRFKTQNIKGVKKSIKTFEPRWDIEMNN